MTEMSAPQRRSEIWAAARPEERTHRTYSVVLADQRPIVYGLGPVSFELAFRGPADYDRFLATDVYTAAKDFVDGRFDIRGDLLSAVSFKAAHPGTVFRRMTGAFLAHLSGWRLEALVQSRLRARRNIEFHYDRSNEFYGAFLDSRMVYSCAYFREPGQSLEEAQLAKLDLICRKLDVRPSDSFLDIGCGWGALLLHAAGTYGATCTGYTLSEAQANQARESAEIQGLTDRVEVRTADYRDLQGSFDKIASVGMFEHVGRRRLHHYFEKVFGLLGPDGLFLNHGIVRPQCVRDGPESRFLRKYVFPGGELAHLSDVLRAAEDVGFEVLDVENLRPHYAMTCSHWVRRLASAERFCTDHVGREAYRIWLLYLAASSLSFEEGQTDVCQVLFAKRTSRTRRLTREYILENDYRRS
jgi:cyclopropane-fatty-acyl-phospholipid synthase